MRLANRLKNHIKRCILNSFGDVDVFLFGSRVDDAKKGGDIDLAGDVDLSPAQFRKYKIKFISELVRTGLGLKIDIVPFKSSDTLLRDEIRKTALKI